MTETSMPTLTEQLREKKIQDRLAVEKITSEQFGLLKKHLRKQYSDIENSITKNTDKLKTRLTKSQFKFWLIPFIASLLVVPALILGTLWTNRFLDESIREKVATLSQHNRTLDRLTAVGITHQERKPSLFLITANDKQPQVFQDPNFPNRWIVQITE